MNFLDDLVDFEELHHTYTNRRTKRKYLSVTTMKDKYKKPFPREYMSLYKSIERLSGNKTSKLFSSYINTRDVKAKEYMEEAELFGKPITKDEAFLLATTRFVQGNRYWTEEEIRQVQKDLLVEWDLASTEGKTNGTAFHNMQEAKAKYIKRVYNGEYVMKLSPEYDNKGLDRPHLSYSLPDGFYTELLMYLHSYELAGQADMVYIETIRGVRYVDVDDYKTDKKITKFNTYQNFLPPIDHLQASDLNGYSLQISTYMYMCEYYGFVPRNLHITHAREGMKRIPIPYLKKEVKSLLDIREKELKLVA